MLVLAAAVPLWWLASWLAADAYFQHELARAYRQQSDEADRHLTSLLEGYERIIHVRLGMPQVLALQASTKALLTGRSNAADAGRRLKADAALLGLDALAVADAQGNIIAASSTETEGNSVSGQDAGQYDFHALAAGKPGYRLVVGRRHGEAGVALFAPVMDKGRLLGVMTGHLDLAPFSNWLMASDAFLTDREGVILLARDDALLMHIVKPVHELDPRAMASRYHVGTITVLPMEPWGDPRYPELLRVAGRSHPVIHRARPVASGNEPVVHELWPFPQLQICEEGRRNAILISGTLGTALIALLALVLARRAERNRTELAIAERERQFRTLANNSPDNILRFDCTGRCVYANQHAQQEAPAGMNPVGLRAEEIDGAEERPLAAAVRRTLDTGEQDRIQIGTVTPEGAGHVHEIRLIPERDENGGLVGVLAIGRDITGLKRNEAALAAQNLLLAQHREQLEHVVAARTRELTAANQQLSLKSYALNQVREAVFLVAEDARLLYVNNEACRSLGYSEAALLSMTVMDIDRNVTEAGWRDEWSRFCESGVLLIETEQQRKDGTRLTVEVHGTHVVHQGKSYNLALVRDVTERKRMEKALDDERRLFVGGPNVAFKWKAEPGWPVEYVSPNVTDQFGYSPEDLITARVPYPQIVHPDDVERITAEMRQYAEAGAACFEQEYRIRRADGDYRWIYDFTVVVRNAAGQATHYHGHLMDITERKLAEEALKESEEKYRSLIDKIQAGVIVHGADTRILVSNPEAQRIMGLTEAQMQGTVATDPRWHIVREDGQRARADEYPVPRVLSSGKAIRNCVLGVAHPEDGALTWALVNADPILGKDQEISQVVVTFIDITARRNAEAALAAREREFRILAESIPDNLVRYDRNMRAIYVNPVLEKTLGTAAEAMIGSTVREYHPDGTYEQYAQSVEQVLASGKAVEIEQLVRETKGGPPRLHQIRIVPERGSQGEVTGALAIGRDVTEKKRMEDALRASEQEFRTLAENIPDVIIRYDAQCRKVYINTAATRFLGVKAEELLGKTPLETLQDKRAMPAEIYHALLRKTIDTGVSGEIETVLASVSRQDKRIFNLRFVAERDDQGAIIGALLVGHDITKIKKVEEELEGYQQHLEDLVKVRTKELALARDAAESANRAKSAFLANMSHELRTPLNAILGFAELMERDKHIPRPQRQNLSIINRSGRHLLALINDILEISKIEAGRLELQTSDCDLSELLESVAEPLRLRARQGDLTLQLHVGPDVPRYISTDVGKLRQILINLISNAVKFTERGGVEVQVSARPDGDLRRLEFVVSDTGVGIAEKEMDSIFQPFYQTEQGALLGEGTGLGLAISRQYAALLGGELLATSDVGHGSVFTLRLTVAQGSGGIATASRRHPVGLATGEPVRRILIVEDQPDSQHLLQQVLSHAGFETRLATNGEEAVSCFQAWQPDMIWMDMRLPILDGYEATRRIRQLPQGGQVKIAALTASVFKEDRNKILAAGCDEVLAKPVVMDHLFATMARLLGVRLRYEEDAPAMPPSFPSRALNELPASVREALYSAARRLDVEATAAVIGDIRHQAPELAEQLTALVRAYQYDRLASLCHPTEEQQHE